MPKQATLKRFIQLECCCRMPDDKCVGVGFLRTKERPWPAVTEGKLCPVPAGERCRFFEVCVLPLSTRTPEFTDAGNEYFYTHLGKANKK